MIDIHCHILPGVDDGPKNLVRFLEMAYRAVETGITHIFSTPHHANGHYVNDKETILQLVRHYNRILQQENIPLVIHPGQEIRLQRDIFLQLRMNELLTLANKGKYVLLELPTEEVPAYTQEVIYEFQLIGISPIIVHPERNSHLLEDHQLLYELVQEGALTQLTSSSLLGHFGKKVRVFAEEMIAHEQAHFIATDAHNTSTRGFFLHEAYEMIARQYGQEKTSYFKENAELLLDNKPIQPMPPLPFRKKIFGLF